MDQLEGCIRYHEELLKISRAYMSPGAVAVEESTITYLKELQEIKKRKAAV